MTDLDRLDLLAARQHENGPAQDAFEDALREAWLEVAAELRALRTVAKTASSVSSEPEVRELLLCFIQGHAMIEALAALEHPNYAP